MISYDDGLRLLKEHGVEEHVIRHSLLVSQIGFYVANELVKFGFNINLNLVKVGGILHDIGRGHSHKNHIKIGAEIMRGYGEYDVARVIENHGVISFPHLSIFEDKLVNYADRRVRHDKIVSVEARLDDLAERYSHIVRCAKNSLEAYKNFENNIFSFIGEEKRLLQDL